MVRSAIRRSSTTFVVPHQTPKPAPQPRPKIPAPGTLPKLPQTIFNMEKRGGNGGARKRGGNGGARKR